MKNNAEISPINFSLSNQCFQSFSLFFIDHYKTERFLQTLSDNEYLWPILISNALKQFPVNNNNFSTFGKFIIAEVEKNKKIFNLLKGLSMITNTSGDLPIEFFIKLSSKQRLMG